MIWHGNKTPQGLFKPKQTSSNVWINLETPENLISGIKLKYFWN
jgi:hypothetical protein